MDAKTVCSQIVFPYLESHVDRIQLWKSNWFAQGTASFLADKMFNESNLIELKNRLQRKGRENFIPLDKMGSDSQWRELYKVMETRSVAYDQAKSMMQFFFDKYGIKKFQELLNKMGSLSFSEAFQQVAGMTAKEFYENWLNSMEPGPARGSPADAKEAVLKLTFTIDRDYDADHVVEMFRHADPAGIEWRARSMGIDPEIAKKIRNANLSDAKRMAREIVDALFVRQHDEIETAKQDIRLQWADLLEPFSNAVIRSMQRPWRHPEYICVVSSVHPGQSDWHGNKVAIGYNKSQFWRRMLAHEIVLSNAYQVMFDAHGGDHHELDEWQIWAFSEITAVLILDYPTLNRFWPNMPPAGHYFGGSNYPQLAEFERQLKQIYDNRESFDDFMTKAVPILQQFHHV